MKEKRNQIQELFVKAEVQMEKNNQRTNSVGNRPHYPQLMLFNEKFSSEDVESVLQKMGRVWFQSLRYMISLRYTVTESGEVAYTAAESEESVAPEAVVRLLDEAKKAREVFASMREWRVFNIVDTTDFRSAEEFAAHCRICPKVKETVVDASKAMLIVLLNDSVACRAVATEIRNFLAQYQEYDATVIISNRTRSNELYDMNELYRIVSNVMVLANNDAVSSLDDRDFSSRSTMLYNNSTHLVSYILRERPNRKIAIKLCESICREIGKKCAAPQRPEIHEWNKRLEFSGSRCSVCEDFLKNADIRVDTESFGYLPLRREAVMEKIDFSRVTFNKFQQYSYAEVFVGLIANYCDRELMVDVGEAAGAFRSFVLERCSAAELSVLDDDTVDRLIDGLYTGAVDANLPLVEYFRQSIQIHLRKNVLYPAMKKTLRELRRQAKETMAVFDRVREELDRNIPLAAFDDLGSIYDNFVSNYMQTIAGEKVLLSVVEPGKDEKEIRSGILTAFQKILEANAKHFSLPFIEEWESRLNLTGDRIYRDISNTLSGSADQMIRYYGNYPLNEKMKVFMLHTADPSGANPTKLFEHLRQTFRDDVLVQYFNTGYDDALEALSFIACSGINLVI